MKILPAVLLALMAGSSAAAAQEAPAGPVTRGDVHFVLGWQNLHKPDSQNSNDWINAILFGGVGAGWYWTDNLKTQVDFGGGTSGEQYRYEPRFANGVDITEFSRLTIRQSSVAIGQQYQFFRNQWFHPHVGGGVDIARETTREEYQPVFTFDPVTRTSRQLSPARVEGPEHHVIARPFLETGFKAYMTRRAFFTGDMRLMARHGIDEVLFRAGFGIDF
jgi:opacity protein-like surface antigen